MRTILVDRRLFWPGFALSLIGSVIASILISTPIAPPPLASPPSPSTYALAFLIAVLGPVVIICSAYPLYRKRGSQAPLGTALDWPHEAMWPETQLIPVNVWAFAASFIVFFAGAVSLFVLPLQVAQPGTTTWDFQDFLPLWPYLLLVSVVWGTSPLKTVRTAPMD